MEFKKGDEVWVYVHESNSMSIYKGIFQGESKSLDKRRRLVYYTDMLFDNYRDASLVRSRRSVVAKYIFPSLEAAINSMNQPRVIKDILESKRIAK